MLTCRVKHLFVVVVDVLCFVISGTLADIDSGSIGACKFAKHNEFKDRHKDVLNSLDKSLVGKSFSVKDDVVVEDGETWTYFVGICVIPDAAEFGSIDSSFAGAIQSSSGKDGVPTSHVIGRLNDTEISSGTNWISLEYESGDNYHTHCAGESRRTTIMIVCSEGETKGKLKIVEENNMKTSDCAYLFELEHEVACELTPTGLSVGSIVCIVFFSVLGVYLLGGFLYQRFVVGAKGMEQIPNFHFWKDFGNLQADGCDLICRCGGQPGMRSYRGVGDDQLNSAADEDTERYGDVDDSLLPM